MSITASQCRAARAMLDWSQETLVEGADIELDILCAFEHGHSKLDLELQDRLRAALEEAGISFIDDNQTSAAGGPGVRMLRSPGEFDTDQSKTVQYTENLAPDAPTGAGG
ncbi:XRE family transcriptional regulator [uncultured Agrobacterium sp.]|uniref:helix-turn-helix domain-containing protein n=1 Tax=uncultured Agrobacterium sp. TaxID=157277 RepID=UPI0025FA084F|nr:XRE family transcriptional regulator [uncultured Agrobacterium sp.]